MCKNFQQNFARNQNKKKSHKWTNQCEIDLI